jgi:putative addiction module killer protein
MPDHYELREYLTANGRSPFQEWLTGLRDRQARARIRARLDRLQLGHAGDCHPVGHGVYELRFFHGPGYRVYLAFDAGVVVLLLCGDDQSSQSRDIERAKRYWQDYRSRADG